MTERTFLDPLRDGELLIRDVENELDDIACAFRTLGMDALADRISNLLEDLRKSRVHTAAGRDMMLGIFVNGTEQATRNMIKMALAGDATENNVG